MTIQQAKEMDMVNYLSGLGFEPKKISGQHYWYLSPFRHETNPSFKVNRNLNRWYDFAEGRVATRWILESSFSTSQL